MTLGDDRWVEVTPSQFDHETKGLKLVRELLPNTSPYRAWSNFEFRDNHGRWHEVDLLVLGRGRLHLVELKYYSGVLRGNDHTWIRAGRRPEDSPLKLARRKAQYLASRLRDQLAEWARQQGVRIPDLRDGVPFIQEAIFLHHPNLRCELGERESLNLYGLDQHEARSGLPGISTLLLERPEAPRVTTPTHERILPQLMSQLGLVPRRERTAGSWVIQESLLSEGEGWQDWLANHQVTQTQEARIRFQVPPPGAPEQAARELARLAEHEFATMSRLVHDGLLRPLDIVSSEGLGTGLVYPYDDNLQRLDLWLSAQDQGLSLQTQLALIRQVAEAVHYAHGSAVAHRALSPDSIWVRSGPDGSVKALVGGWQSAGSTSAGTRTTADRGVTALHRAGGIDVAADDDDAHAAFRAPEDTWQAAATDRFRLDVFGLGALAFYILTGKAPASGPAALRDRLREQGGLDLTPELPGASEPLRRLVLEATRPSPSDRTPDLAVFLEQLAEAERPPQPESELALDPLDAAPGALLADRFELLRRLGQGSTAVGLLVADRSDPKAANRVLKVALDEAAARRLEDEAAVLARLDSPRIVRLVEGPIDLHGRRALLLESAGEQTLAEALRQRTRMSLDLLQRYGTDLLEALVVLDKAGVDHRDIKPANLGIRASRGGDRAKHLVLFDFSLTRAAASAIEAGTPPYLDPFLSDRDRYDSAAERYAVAAVLFEMATGTTPSYEPKDAHPATGTGVPVLTKTAFDPSIAPAMMRFFGKALARPTSERHDTAAEMLQEWEAAFPASVTTVPDNADELAEQATMDTPLRKAGLSNPALSAIEPLHVETVGDLVSLDPVKLNQFSGAADITRREVKSRARQWRIKFADAIRGQAPQESAGSLPSPQDAADLLLAHTGKGRSETRNALARLVMGVGTELDAFATHAQLGAHLPKPTSAAGATQQLAKLQDGWAGDRRTLDLLLKMDHLVRERVSELGGVATVEELTDTLLAAMSPRGLSTHDTERGERRLVQGMLRAVLDRQRALVRADAEIQALHTRRREGKVVLIAADPALLEVAELLGREADRLVSADTGEDHDRVIPADLAAERLAPLLADLDDPPTELADPARLVRLAAGVATRAAASGAGELHHRDLPASAALALTLRGVTAHRGLTAHAVRERVRSRFPSLPSLPERPRLDDVVTSAGIGLVYDAEVESYRPLGGRADTTGLETRQPTRVVVETAPVSTAGVVGQRLVDSRKRRSFLALGVPGHRLERATQLLVDEYDARPLDVTEVLLRGIREQSDAAGMKWATVQAADAAAAGSRPAQGLATLVARAIPAVQEAIEQAMAESEDGERPLLLTDAAPLARYGHLGVLSQWGDLTRPRRRAVWLLVPQLRSNHGPLLDGKPVTLSSPGQFVALDTEWIDTRSRATSATTAGAAP